MLWEKYFFEKLKKSLNYDNHLLAREAWVPSVSEDHKTWTVRAYNKSDLLEKLVTAFRVH